MNMHFLFMEVMEFAFDLPLKPFHKHIRKYLSEEIDFNIES